ncbi:MAG: DUF6922 domain-containing protein [Coraliomargarita sp.]
MSAATAFLDQLSDHLFWDVDRLLVDPDNNAGFLLPRIVERGTRADVRAAWSYYGEDQAKAVLLIAPSLTRKTIAFFANQFQLPREAFRAYGRESNWAQ